MNLTTILLLGPDALNMIFAQLIKSALIAAIVDKTICNLMTSTASEAS